jgi:hypothetical protein
MQLYEKERVIFLGFSSFILSFSFKYLIFTDEKCGFDKSTHPKFTSELFYLFISGAGLVIILKQDNSEDINQISKSGVWSGVKPMTMIDR